MITRIVEIVIELAAILAGVGGVAFFAYFIALVWWEHREERAFLEEHRREQSARRAGHEPEPSRSTGVRPAAPVATYSHSLQHHP